MLFCCCWKWRQSKHILVYRCIPHCPCFTVRSINKKNIQGSGLKKVTFVAVGVEWRYTQQGGCIYYPLHIKKGYFTPGYQALIIHNYCSRGPICMFITWKPDELWRSRFLVFFVDTLRRGFSRSHAVNWSPKFHGKSTCLYINMHIYTLMNSI